jgi:beta-lactamase superfamily II metal-dependent hydrolase
MRYFPSIFLFLLLLEGVLCSVVSAAVVETYIFSIGQGNFILTKAGKECLVVDVGSGKNGRNPLKPHRIKMEPDGAIYKKLESIGKEISRCWLCITHNHWDHFCLFSQLKALWGSNPIIFPSSENRLTIKPQFLAKSFYDSFRDQIAVEDHPPEIGNIYVYRLPPHRNAQKDHEKNLVVFVKYGTVLFILPGDADGDYLNLNAGVFMAELEALGDGCTHCCIVLPHHGSNSNGTLALPLAAQRRLVEKNCREVIFIISSDPEETDCLPRPAVLPLLPREPETKGHYYSCFNERCLTTSPVFITCEATDGNGYLITTDGNDLKLFDGIAMGKPQLYPIR